VNDKSVHCYVESRSLQPFRVIFQRDTELLRSSPFPSPSVFARVLKGEGGEQHSQHRGKLTFASSPSIKVHLNAKFSE
jgi:hypothetical protein